MTLLKIPYSCIQVDLQKDSLHVDTRKFTKKYALEYVSDQCYCLPAVR